MPADGQSAPATPDELATLYLRARDVRCPGCGYNRRDGVTAACPECGNRLDITRQTPSIRIDKRLAKTMLACVWVIAACSIVINGFGITAGILGWGELGYILIVLACFGSLVATIGALHFAAQANKHRHASCLGDMMISLAVAAALLLLAIGSLFI